MSRREVEDNRQRIVDIDKTTGQVNLCNALFQFFVSCDMYRMFIAYESRDDYNLQVSLQNPEDKSDPPKSFTFDQVLSFISLFHFYSSSTVLLNILLILEP